MKSFHLLSILILILFSCGQEGEDNVENALSDEGGRCNMKWNNTNRICIEYPDSTSSTTASANCTSLYNSVYEAIFISEDPNVVRGLKYEPGKNLDCSGSNVLGSCSDASETTGIATYFSNDSFWSTAEAQSNCETDLGGTWTAN